MAGSDLFVGTLDLLILRALEAGPLHGYAIGRWIRESTESELDIQEGVLYPALHRLERRGLLDEEWGITDTNREAKFYKLTRAGRKHLKSELARWERHIAAVNAALSYGGRA
jgi:transcriptional regulator